MWLSDDRYGKPKYKDFDGAGWPEFIRRCRATKLDGVHCDTGQPIREQVPQVKHPYPDRSRLRAKEYVKKLMLVFRRSA